MTHENAHRPRPVPRRTVLGLALAPLAGAAVGLAPNSAWPAHAAADTTGLPFRNPRLSFAARVEDLLKRLTQEEKVGLLHQYQQAVPRLGIQAFRTGTEALHGLAWLGKATVFPQALGLASTWNPELVRAVGSAVGDEARGLQHERPANWGLNLWAPVANPLRDPRWGRNEEGYSEDPYLTGVMATAYGSGMRGDDPRHLKTAPTLKHYLGNNNETRRTTTSSQLRPRVLKEYEERAFRPAVAAGAVTGVMASYNLVNGRPATVNPDLGGAVRSWTDGPLFHVTDADAPNNLLPGQQDYYRTRAEGDAAALKAGIDSFTTDSADPSKTLAALRSALAQGLIGEKDLDTAVRHVLHLRFRLGEFDPDGGPYAGIGRSVIDSPAHRALARRAADEAMVLLKNEGGALPLDAARIRKLAVVGPLENAVWTDWYSGELPYAVTPRAGIAERLGSAGKVAAAEGVDRIALRNAATGRYVTAGDGAQGAVLAEKAGTAEEAARFDVADWGEGVVTLRSAANGKYVGLDGGALRNDQAQPGGWFVRQQFRLEKQEDEGGEGDGNKGDGGGTVLLRYAGYDADEAWFGPKKYVRAGDGGVLELAEKAEATRYTREVLRDGVAEAAAAAKGADAAVVVVGSMPAINGRENRDRRDMDLPARQSALVEAVRAANPRTVVVLVTSYPETVTREQARVPALLWSTHAGQESGHAVAGALFGDRNPAGRLTQTWYRSADDLPDLLDYDLIKSPRTYLYFTGPVLYPFGHGLSYTSFRYGPLHLPSGPLRRGERRTVRLRVTNTGTRDGDEVVQLYTRRRGSRDPQPDRQLRAFARVRVPAGGTRTVRLTLRAEELEHWDVTRGRYVLESGEHEVLVGASSRDVRQRAVLRVAGEEIPPRDLRRTTRAVDFDDYAGVRLVDESKTGGDAVEAGDGDRLVFRDAQLGDGARTFTARCAREAPGDARVEVRLGSPTGPLLGTAVVPGGGDRYRYGTVTARLRGARGRHDVHLVFAGFSGAVRLSTFSLR